jgi:hypothetical protein
MGYKINFASLSEVDVKCDVGLAPLHSPKSGYDEFEGGTYP